MRKKQKELPIEMIIAASITTLWALKKVFKAVKPNCIDVEYEDVTEQKLIDAPKKECRS